MRGRHDFEPVKGINYDVGTEFGPGELSRSIWSPTDVIRDMGAIRDESALLGGSIPLARFLANSPNFSQGPEAAIHSHDGNDPLRARKQWRSNLFLSDQFSRAM